MNRIRCCRIPLLLAVAVAALAALFPWQERAAVAADPLSRRPELIDERAERAIQRGLEYLRRTQASDGSWRTGSGYAVTMSSLAGLALMASGSTPAEGPFAEQIRKAVNFVLSRAQPNGCIGDLNEEGARTMYSHGFGMLFLSQAYGMERNEERRRRMKRVIERAIVLTGQSQSAAGGWLYTPDSGGDEGSVTVTQIQGLRAARNVGIKVPKSTIDRACKYIENSANPDGGIRYTASGGGESRPPITAAAVATMYNAGAYENPVAVRALNYIKNLLKQGNTAAVFSGHQFYATLYCGQAMYLSGDDNWRSYFPKARDELLAMQNNGDGSWQGDGVGEVYGTAIACLTLQLPYKYLPILQR